ncbi:hypothetical protein NL54_12860 [Pantoea stewartii]|uniref:hypothetical protein n=1 Tax=Pantoea stewartii TaxID=66269 RepID=UPI0005438954|nr:hypothetical protein [Pantoea stewartii]KHE00930.1 hypothetical protein NL54_12860 [Pantoea stewartii]KHN58587.1 hypothetical protein OI73_21775 [Pantoea stewartii]
MKSSGELCGYQILGKVTEALLYDSDTVSRRAILAKLTLLAEAESDERCQEALQQAFTLIETIADQEKCGLRNRNWLAYGRYPVLSDVAVNVSKEGD